MSARQRSRLANQALLVGSMEAAVSDSEQESELSTQVHAKNTLALYSSSSEQESSSEAEGKSDSEVTSNPVKSTPALPVQVKEDEQIPAIDELEYLDSIIEQNTQLGQHSTKSTSTQIADIYSTLLRIEDKSMDVTAVRRRGEEMFFMEREQQGQQGAQRRGNGRLRGINPHNNPHNNAHNPQQGNVAGFAGFGHRMSNKRYMFGAPSDDWQRPPAYVSGGIGMSKTRYPAVHNNKHNTGAHNNMHSRHRNSSTGSRSANSGNRDNYKNSTYEYYTYEWSAEFTFLHKQYQYIESTGDANLLIMFLTHFPYHPQGLLQLALVYARLQQTDKAAELVRRALYVLECAALESFKVQEKHGDKLKQVRMDPYVHENGIYFAVLYRYMELCSMQGHHTIAADLCRYILSLHPADDAQYLLFTLDYYLLKAERHDMLLAYCGLSQQSVCDAFNTADRVATAVFSFMISSPYKFDLLDDTYIHTSIQVHVPVHTVPSDDNSGSGDSCSRALQHLPNWWFSLALSQHMVEESAHTRAHTQTTASTATASKHAVSTVLLQAALFRWPFMLAPMLHKMGVDTQGFPVLGHEWFKQAEKRLPEDGYLQQISRVYATRTASLWSQPSVLQWLTQTCSELSVLLNTTSTSVGGLSIHTTHTCTHTAHAVAVAVDVDVLNYTALHDTTNHHNRALASYADASPEEYEVLPPFPGGATPIDPTLDDPAYMLSGAVRFRDFMDSEGRFMFAVPAPYVSTTKVGGNDGNVVYESSGDEGDSGDEQVHNMRHVRNLLQYGLHFGDGDAGAHMHAHMQSDTRASNIDFSLPLMQLFLATLFPWIFVRPLNRR